MAKAEVAVTDTNAIVDELMRRQEMIARRAYELFRNHATMFNADIDDWLQAERELFPQPSIELRRADDHFEIEAALPGVDPKKVEVKVTADDVLITAEREGTPVTAAKAGVTPDGKVQYFRSIHLPEPIDPGSVKADFKQGLLHLTAPIVKSGPVAVEVRG